METQNWIYEALTQKEVLAFMGFMALVLLATKHDDHRH